MDGRAPRIALVAGEASGDLLGAGLVAELKQRFPGATFAGIGGPRMRAEGFDAWHDSGELAVMGLAEVLRHLPRLLRLRRNLCRRLLDWKPDVFIGIDAPDFNLGLERRLKQAGLRTVHYVSPSVWAWREGRAAKIGRSADLVLCLFPMEPPIYQRHGVDARFVGHPLADAFPAEPDRAAARARLGLPADAPVLAVLPGSRLGEIRRLWPVFIEATKLLTLQVPGLVAAVPAADPACRAAIEKGLDGSQLANVAIFDGQAHDVMVAADVVMLASGTAALEAMLAKRPMVVGYRISALTYRLVMSLGMMRTSRYSLPNVLANEPIVPELMQRDCTPENLAGAVMTWFRDPEARAALLPRYEHIHAKLRGDASKAAAEAVAGLLAR
ncbi:lipid-A-disaccharide synthase [Arenimonas caeni]|jgi:lipid-A-disaccharide synthase|uniref:lipid-A-disaccharide synthase n=1 Tax=Arenimonas caeni TaxID=2058085 RepID=UPI002A36CEF6|nr:lipid-A-disaccharide synthase [Arenimonas caeni]MDY0021497.1 lipid-A-disaccharide synthase [Arenimonas caeni]